MAERHEEKYIISYPQYLLLRARAAAVMTPDANSKNGSYLISSLYYDDSYDTALKEKQDGLTVHTKYRVRTYNGDSGFIKLEKKVKIGIMTEKQSARIGDSDIQLLSDISADLQKMEAKLSDMAADMRRKGLHPAVTVRYKRDAFVHEPTNTRLTFDTEIDALPPDAAFLFDSTPAGVPALPRNSVIMEIKYDRYLPSFVRKLTACYCEQLSVSKYALCREALH